MQFSLTQLLLVAELGFIFMLARRCGRLDPVRMETQPVYFYLLWLAAYGFITSALGARGFFVSDELLKTLPGFWLQLVTIAVMVIPVIMFSKVRNAIRQIVDATPWHWFAYFQGLRIAALGTLYKTMIGRFPAYFEYIAPMIVVPLFVMINLWVVWRLLEQTGH